MSSPAEPPVQVAYHHVDVFSAVAYAGNSVAVIVNPPPLTSAQMALITRELRHFETVFVQTGPADGQARARVFDLAEELDFAGHPVLGAAAVLHQATDAEPGAPRDWTIGLKARGVQVRTIGRTGGHVSAVLDAGKPEFLGTLPRAERPAVAAALGLTAAELDDSLPLEVVSTGLRYLVVLEQRRHHGGRRHGQHRRLRRRRTAAPWPGRRRRGTPLVAGQVHRPPQQARDHRLRLAGCGGTGDRRGRRGDRRDRFPPSSP